MDFAIVVYYLGIYLDVSLRFVSMGLMPSETNFIKVECSPSGAEINSFADPLLCAQQAQVHKDTLKGCSLWLSKVV